MNNNNNDNKNNGRQTENDDRLMKYEWPVLNGVIMRIIMVVMRNQVGAIIMAW